MELVYFLRLAFANFHQIGSIDQLGLLVVMSVHMYVCIYVSCPLPITFLKEMKSKVLNMDFAFIIILIHRGERARHYILLFSNWMLDLIFFLSY